MVNNNQFPNTTPVHPTNVFVTYGPATTNLSIRNNHTNYYTSTEYNNLKSEAKSLRIISLNINSLRKHNDEFSIFLSTIKVLPDVIILSEIRHNVEEILNQYIDDYSYHIQYPVNNRCGGIALLVRRNIDYTNMNNLCIKHADVENLLIRIKTNKGFVFVSGIYKHPTLNINEFKSLISEHIRGIPIQHTLVLAGDTNIDLLKIDNDNQVKNFYEKLVSLNCTQIIESPTRITNHSQTLIDHIIVRTNTKLKLSRGIFLNQFSDHLCTFVNLELKCHLNQYNRPLIRIYSERNKEKFKMSLDNIDNELNNLCHNDYSSNAKWQSFQEIITNKFNDAFPLKTLSRKKQKDKHWLTPSIMKSIKTKQKLYKKWREFPTDSNLRRYNKYKKILNVILRKAKILYYENIFSNDKCNKKTWDEINTLLNNKNTYETIESLKVNDVVYTNKKDIANVFNNHFSTIGEKMSTEFNSNHSTRDYSHYMPTSLNKSILLNKTTIEKVEKIIDSMSSKNSTGIDYISQKLLKLVKSKLLRTITNLINESIEDKVYPDVLKIAKIIPVHKSKAKDDCNHYRPISLLSVFNKIFEKTLHNDLTNFIENNGILYCNQFGFRKFHSTIDALIKTHDYIIEEKRKGNKIIGIFLDLSKAFDSIDNNILIKKLNTYGIRGPYNDLLTSYVTNRQCFTQIGEEKSTLNKIKYGIPQGSVLGPLLFSLYVNDIKQLARNAEINLFADDTNIFCSSKSYANLIQNCNNVLKLCKEWLRANKLTLNTNKSHFVDFSKNRNSNVPKILYIDNEVLLEQDHTKYLGMILQYNLKWDMHIDGLIKKLNSRIPLFYQIRNILPQDKKVLIFNSLSLSNIIYGIELYANKIDSNVKRLQKCQNRILKILFIKNHFTNTNVLHKNIKIMKIKDLVQLRQLLLSHKVIHERHKVNTTHSSMIVNQPIRNLRNINNFTITAAHYEYRNKITESACIFWNELSNDTKSIINRNAFKEHIKTFCINNY